MNEKLNKKPVIGVVGGVGAGKSTVAGELERLGCRRIDADVIGHELLNHQDVANLLRQRWGGKIFQADGKVNRSALGQVVFNNPTELQALNSIMYPRIRSAIEQQIEQAQADQSVKAVVLDAAIMIEAGWHELTTHMIFVEAGEQQRAQRSAAKGWDRANWQGRENSQISLDSKKKHCYFTIDNRSSVSHLQDCVRNVFYRILQAEDRP